MIIFVFVVKKVWSKCKKLWASKFIFDYWVLNSSVKIKMLERSLVKVISLISHLFPDNPLLKNDLWHKTCWVLNLLNVFIGIFLHGSYSLWLSFIIFLFFSFLLFRINNALFLHHLGFTFLFCSNSCHWSKLIVNY